MPINFSNGTELTSTMQYSDYRIVRDGLVLLIDQSGRSFKLGEMRDDSGQGNHVYEEISISDYHTGSSDWPIAWSFNGTASVARINNHSSLNPSNVSIEAWVNFDDNSNSFIFEKGNVNTQYSLFSHGADIVFRTKHSGDSTYNTLSTTKTNAGISNGTWHHIVGSFDGSNKRLYVDTTQVASSSKTGNIVTTSNGASIGRFGGTSSGYFFTGKIGKVAVYNRGITADEVSINFEATRGIYGR